MWGRGYGGVARLGEIGTVRGIKGGIGKRRKVEYSLDGEVEGNK